MRFGAFLLATLLLLGGPHTGRADSQSAGQKLAGESDDDEQKLFRFMVGIHNYTSEFTSRSQILEEIANGDAEDRWMLSRGGGENQPRGKQVLSSIVYPAKYGDGVYNFAIRCDHAYEAYSEFFVRLAKFEISDGGRLSEVFYNETGFHRTLGSRFDAEVQTLMRSGVTGETLARELLFSIDLSGVPPAYRNPQMGLPRLYIGGFRLKRTGINLSGSKNGPYYEISLTNNVQDKEIALVIDALQGNLYFTTETGVQKVRSNYEADSVLKACLISTQN